MRKRIDFSVHRDIAAFIRNANELRHTSVDFSYTLKHNQTTDELLSRALDYDLDILG